MATDFTQNDLDALLNLKFNDKHLEMREFAKVNNVPIIQDRGLAFLETIIGVKRPKRILEIGTAIGYSSSRMSLVCGSIVDTIERDSKMYELAVANIKELNLDNKVNVIFKDALEAFDVVKDNKYDMIFIDAAKSQYTKFFNLYEPLLSQDGIIVCDNMLFHGFVEDQTKIMSRNLRALIRKLKNYHEFILNNPNYNTSIFDIGDGMSVSYRKENV